MYQMTLFYKKVIYKDNNCLISTHQKILNCTLFSIFLGVACLQTPLAKGMASLSCGYICAAYCFDTCKFTFQKKNLDPPIQILYTLLTYMYK